MRAEFFSFSIQCIHLKTSQIRAHTHADVIRALTKNLPSSRLCLPKTVISVVQNKNIRGRTWVLFRCGGFGLTRRGSRVSGAGQSSLRLRRLTPSHPLEGKTKPLRCASRLQLHVQEASRTGTGQCGHLDLDGSRGKNKKRTTGWSGTNGLRRQAATGQKEEMTEKMPWWPFWTQRRLAVLLTLS